MAKVRSNVLVRGLSGKLGDQVVFRNLRDGSTVVCVPPDFSKRKLSKDQKTHHAKFKEAAAYARDAAKSQPIYAELAIGTTKNAYNIALSDWFHAPRIQRVELTEGGPSTSLRSTQDSASLRSAQDSTSLTIRVYATDNVKVAGVKVILRSEAGLVLEQGEALPAEEAWWSYTPQTVLEGKLKVEIRASDLAGNVTTINKDV
ncbi:MAG: hypothetical protein IH588_08280 [Anaerolineales bacterium]|nr:hypothetical protein [Anaerolineales bacterium]